jgi:hypothetical protein
MIALLGIALAHVGVEFADQAPSGIAAGVRAADLDLGSRHLPVSQKNA